MASRRPSREQPRCLALTLHPRLAHSMPLSVDPPRRLRLVDLPAELLFVIALKLASPRDLCALQRASHAFRRLPREDLIWKSLCQQQYGTPVEFVRAFGLTWKQAYRLHRQALHEMVRSTSSQMAGLRVSPGVPCVLRVR